eukprot:GHVH01004236.1.p1 GENE.GHVH01004236.1~~GHVH01004236.1.p1  ORF type:complete len:656 (+),score=110.28 GHVH01004236.1:165-1970(+)
MTGQDYAPEKFFGAAAENSDFTHSRIRLNDQSTQLMSRLLSGHSLTHTNFIPVPIDSLVEVEGKCVLDLKNKVKNDRLETESKYGAGHLYYVPSFEAGRWVIDVSLRSYTAAQSPTDCLRCLGLKSSAQDLAAGEASYPTAKERQWLNENYELYHICLFENLNYNHKDEELRAFEKADWVSLDKSPEGTQVDVRAKINDLCRDDVAAGRPGFTEFFDKQIVARRENEIERVIHPEVEMQPLTNFITPLLPQDISFQKLSSVASSTNAGRKAMTSVQNYIERELNQKVTMPANSKEFTMSNFMGPPSMVKELKEMMIVQFNCFDQYLKLTELTRDIPGGTKDSVTPHILLDGPPGTGKTMLATVLANDSDRPLINVGVENFLSKYRGTSENNFRAVLEASYKLHQLISSCCHDGPGAVILFDEFDSLARRRDASDESGEASKHILIQLITWMDGFNTKFSRGPPWMVGATNLGEEIDMAVRSRFPKPMKMDLPNSVQMKQLFQSNVKSLDLTDIQWKLLLTKMKAKSGRDVKRVVDLALREMINRMNTEEDLDGIIRFSDIMMAANERFKTEATISDKVASGSKSRSIGDNLKEISRRIAGK